MEYLKNRNINEKEQSASSYKNSKIFDNIMILASLVWFCPLRGKILYHVSWKHQNLVKKHKQMQLVDAYGKHQIFLEKISALYNAWKKMYLIKCDF